MTRSLFTCTSLFAFVVLMAHTALASEVTANVPSITIKKTSPQPEALTAPTTRQADQEIHNTPGAVSLVDSAAYQNRYAQTLRDMLEETPGVHAQPRYGQEQRLSIRGSGLARGFHTRGIETLQDGIPLNAADGSGDFYQIDPLALRHIAVYKGGNALSFGSATLGGAINFVTPTAYDMLATNTLRLEGGSFVTVRGSGQTGRVIGDFDYALTGTVVHSDGFRRHAHTQSEAFNANLGYKITPQLETRFYVGAYIVDQDLPGTLSLADALHNPRDASSGALSGDQARNTRTFRLANKTSWQSGIGTLELASWGIRKELFHPIFQVIDNNDWTYGVAPKLTRRFDLGGLHNDLVVGARYTGGSTAARRYVNINGSRGNQTLDAVQDAHNFELYAENKLWFQPDLAVLTGAKLFHALRDYQDKGGLASNPTPKTDSKRYNGLSPKLGLLWQPLDDVQAFVNVTRSQDIPDFSDLTQTIGSTASFVPLKLQQAWTLEAGSRGHYGRTAWDIAAYRSWVRDELMQFTTSSSIPAATFNAPRSVHQGIELAVRHRLLDDVFNAGRSDSLTLQQIWTYSDFRFQDNPVYGDNRLPGVPEHQLRTSITYRHAGGFSITPVAHWVPRGAFADYANTLRVPGYVTFGLQADYEVQPGLHLFLDARNLADRRYVSDISTIKDARTTATSIFYPGDGRSIYAGLRYQF